MISEDAKKKIIHPYATSSAQSLRSAISKIDNEIKIACSTIKHLENVKEELATTLKNICPHTNCKMISDDECICLDCGAKV